jgi:hypothetical protein
MNNLSDPRREDDFPPWPAGPGGVIRAVWASYSGLYDEIGSRSYPRAGAGDIG